MLGFGVIGIAAWGGFLTYVTNQERLASSVVRQVLVNLRESGEVQTVLGEAIRPEPAWYLNGDPWIHGGVRTIDSHLEPSFQVAQLIDFTDKPLARPRRYQLSSEGIERRRHFVFHQYSQSQRSSLHNMFVISSSLYTLSNPPSAQYVTRS